MKVKTKRLAGKAKRVYRRKCGVCGFVHEQSKMIRTDLSPNGWICRHCWQENNDPEWEEEV